MPVFKDLAEKEKRPLKTRSGKVPPPTVLVTEAGPEMLRIRLLTDIKGSRRGTFLKGQAAMLPADVAREWMKMGLAEMDKSLDGPPETK